MLFRQNIIEFTNLKKKPVLEEIIILELKRGGSSVDLTAKKIEYSPDCMRTVDSLFCMEYILLICHQGIENVILGF